MDGRSLLGRPLLGRPPLAYDRIPGGSDTETVNECTDCCYCWDRATEQRLTGRLVVRKHTANP